ncbi:hypothetical protein BGZ99_004096 [Dissophora globulifera]|uniref:Uncharacterized protein n=1 Tax=Dissophora globulifera TaxID=979702 RepID=A0A9P6RND4_9FUNG|nr:hypothetical protein BGZ99_004096 [Dissophora globulifera]
MVAGPLPSPVIDTRLILLAGQHNRGSSLNSTTMVSAADSDHCNNTTGTTDSSKLNGTFKQSVIPAHSSLPSPLSPPLSVSPLSFSSSMADFIASRPNEGSSAASLPPLHPSSTSPPPAPGHSSRRHHHSSSTSSSSDTQSRPQQHRRSVSITPAAVPYIETSPEAWLAHAAQQRRHLSTSSFSSTASSIAAAVLTPDHTMAQSPVNLEFGESERIQEDPGLEADEQEPELNVFVRPSELRASLMARAKLSSAKVQLRRSESLPPENGSRLSMQSNQRQVVRRLLCVYKLRCSGSVPINISDYALEALREL